MQFKNHLMKLKKRKIIINKQEEKKKECESNARNAKKNKEKDDQSRSKVNRSTGELIAKTLTALQHTSGGAGPRGKRRRTNPGGAAPTSRRGHRTLCWAPLP